MSRRQLLERYTHVREDHLRYMQKWGVIRPSDNGHGEAVYAFPDLAVIRQADEALAGARASGRSSEICWHRDRVN